MIYKLPLEIGEYIDNNNSVALQTGIYGEFSFILVPDLLRASLQPKSGDMPCIFE